MTITTGISSRGNTLKPPSILINKSNQFFSSNPYPTIPNHTKKIPNHRLSASITSSDPNILSPPTNEFLKKSDSDNKRDVNFAEKIDSWMQDSVTDIVKNLKQAPLLVQIYSENGWDSENKRVKIKMEKALLDDWPVARSEWESGELKSPDGLIFVEELGNSENDNQDCEEGVARAWGIVVQGKGVECGPACYMLKTNRVCAGIGLGFCTHFCLMKVNNFRDSAFQQFKDSWLLQ